MPYFAIVSSGRTPVSLGLPLYLKVKSALLTCSPPKKPILTGSGALMRLLSDSFTAGVSTTPIVDVLGNQ